MRNNELNKFQIVMIIIWIGIIIPLWGYMIYHGMIPPL